MKNYPGERLMVGLGIFFNAVAFATTVAVYFYHKDRVTLPITSALSLLAGFSVTYYSGRMRGTGEPLNIDELREDEHFKVLSVYKGFYPSESNWYLVVRPRSGDKLCLVWKKDQNRPAVCFIREGFWYKWTGKTLESIVDS